MVSFSVCVHAICELEAKTHKEINLHLPSALQVTTEVSDNS